MNKDTRLSGVLHVLMHLGHVEKPLTSEVLAKTMGTNPAVFRRTMAGIRNAGIVHSEKGHGGGWTLSRPLTELTLLDIYKALGGPTLFAIGNRNDAPNCMVETAVNDALAEAMEAAQILLTNRFGQITLDQITPDRGACKTD